MQVFDEEVQDAGKAKTAAILYFTLFACVPPWQVFDEYDEEVQDAEAAETAAGQRREEKDSELKPFKLADRWGKVWGKCRS